MTTPDEVILDVHDTTELDFTSQRTLHDQLGPSGDGRGRGLLQHNSLAVRARDGLLLGLAHQQVVCRRPARRGETRTPRHHRDRESILWQRGLAGVGPTPDGSTWGDVCDRGADWFAALHAALQLGHQALIRACQDRCILVEQPDGELRPDKLMTFARSLAGQVSDVVAGAQKGGRPARTAQVQLAGAVVWIEPPKQLPNRRAYPDRRVWVLLSTLPAQTEMELRTRRDWYAWCWPVAEDYHQAETTGCGEEKVRFQDAAALQASLAVLSAVAVRVVQWRQVARAYPKEPAQRVATPWKSPCCSRPWGVAATPLKTVAQFVRGVAQMGGFLGRKCDGKPGWKTLWRGYQKLQGFVEATRLHEQIVRQ